MNNIQSTLPLLILSFLLVSCNKTTDDEMNENIDCVFEQIDENMDGLIDDFERGIMNECMTNAIHSKLDIINNLIGDWKLVGYGTGWITTPSQPCALISISHDELTFEYTNEHIDTITTHLWEIEELNNGASFRLKVTPDEIEGLFINQFCESYMYGDATPSDGNMYLYKKIK